MSENIVNFGALGMDLEQSLKQLKKGKLTYALNAMIEGADGQYVNYQNEPGNEACVTLPEGYKVVGIYTIYEKDLIIYFLHNPETDENEIGSSVLNECTYTKIINAPCLNFSIDHPILSAAHRVDNCSTQIFWVDGYNKDRFLDLNNLPYKEIVQEGACENIITGDIDCNKMLLNPNFSIPQLAVVEVDSDGTLESGTYQFAIQYANASGQAYTSFYSVTNPLPIFDVNNITLNFNAPVGKSIRVSIANLDSTGFYDYYNLAVVKTVNNISTVEMVGHYKIVGTTDTVLYAGQKTIDLAIEDIFEKYPVYPISQDLTSVNDILVRDQLTGAERLNYQEIASKISIQWQTWRLPADFNYKNEILAANLKGYMRDEVYPFEIVFLLKDGRQTDRFHIPGRTSKSSDLETVWNDDVVDGDLTRCDDPTPLPKWKVYNTGNVLGTGECNSEDSLIIGGEILTTPIRPPQDGNPTPPYPPVPTPPPAINTDCCIGPYEYGDMSYWESTEEYPCDASIWGELAGQKIRHHKFPDSLVSHIHDSEGNIYPMGIKINLNQIRSLIQNSSLTQEQKDEIVGIKIVHGNRANNKSVVAKGLIHNVGQYGKDGQNYFYPNYPYNDLRPDPFISIKETDYTLDDFNDAQASVTGTIYVISVSSNAADTDIFEFVYTDIENEEKNVALTLGNVVEVCASSKPLQTGGPTGYASVVKKPNQNPDDCKKTTGAGNTFIDTNAAGFASDNSKKRFVFHSPDTHFYQPFLGNILKLETIEHGESFGHFIQTKDHAKYRLLTANVYALSIAVAGAVAVLSAEIGLSNKVFDGTAFMLTYRSLVDILERTAPRVNYAYHYTSVGKYTDSIDVPNAGNKQRLLDLSIYLNPGVADVGDISTINNFQRESSVYLRSTKTLPFTNEAGGPEDQSRWLPSCSALSNPASTPISSYYASIKKTVAAQYGQIYNYESVDTGYQFRMDDMRGDVSVFGGDIFINRFAYKAKLPFFFDNRVKSLDDSDVFYNELGNVGVPNYWFSMDSTKGNLFNALFAIPVTNFHCQPSITLRFYKQGRFYLFAYGIPYFYTESEVNVDYRQAFNTKEGDFYPHVSSGIPDEWLQEANVSIAFDNTYYYNKTYSKQNKENYFSFLPPDYSSEECRTIYPFRAVFSESLNDSPASNLSNNWLIYKPASYFDFPQSYGKLTALDGIEYRQVLARFENRTQIYNALLTAPTSQADVYLGQTLFSSQVPPVDLSNTDMGYAGSRHKFLLKTEYGVISVDDKRGHVFLMNGKQIKNLTSIESGVEQFFNRHLQVQLPNHIANVPLDNNFNGVGIHGVYDAKYNRLILTKIDYVPTHEGITYDKGVFYYNGEKVLLSDTGHFCNKSFTISYDFDYQSWISFHSYLPEYYVGANNFFLSGQEGKTWKHHTSNTFCYFYENEAPYIIEYPYAFEYQDEILQAVSDYSKTLQYIDGDPVEVDDVYFNKVILYNNQQCSGVLNLHQKPKNNLNSYMKYPLYNTDSKTILYTKSDNFYKINQFWSLVKDVKQPIFKKTCQALSFDKELNQDNMDYGKRSFKKAPLRAKDLKCRFILDDRTDTRIISQLVTVETQKSFK
jgi:hypothetical protein